MTGDEREEGRSEVPPGRETNPPDTRMKRSVIMSDVKVLTEETNSPDTRMNQ